MSGQLLIYVRAKTSDALPGRTSGFITICMDCAGSPLLIANFDVPCSCRFIFAFGGAGLFTFLTAATGLAGVGWNSRWLLGTYSVLIVIMLLVQAAVAITLFADDSWRKYLPPDQTGEFHRVRSCILLMPVLHALLINISSSAQLHAWLTQTWPLSSASVSCCKV